MHRRTARTNSERSSTSLGRFCASSILLGFLLHPHPAGAISSRTFIAPIGEVAGDVFGSSVSSAGDMNGDGYGDVIAGASAYNGNTGRAYVYFGGPRADTVADLILNGEAANNFFGGSVASAGDVNRDGYDDVIVGAYGYSGSTGRAYVYFGGSVVDAVADMTLTGEATTNNFGTSVSSAGDMNGDGFGDVVVGAYGYSGNTGRAYVYFGGTSPNAVADLVPIGLAAGSMFGISVSSAGDMNGDGYGDLIVGADGFSTNTGRAYVYFGGSVPNPVADLTLIGEATSNYFGISVSSSGDVNSDGYSDVIVGADGYSTFTGRAYIYYGGASSDAVPDLTLTGEAVSNDFGHSVSSAGDVNGDGRSDVVVGAFGYGGNTGRCYVYFGGLAVDPVADLTLTGDAGELFGASVASAGDVNQDGHGDLVVGATGYGALKGRAYVRLVYSYEIMSPNGGEQWAAGLPATVRWRGHDVADLAFSADAGATWMSLVVGVGGAEENEFTVAVPAIPTEFARIRASVTGQQVTLAASDVSDANFRVFLPSPPPAAAARRQLTLNAEAAGSTFGQSVSSAGDVNGDGYGDVIVGAHLYSSNTGRAYVYYGGPGADNVADLTLTGETTSSFFGVFVSSAGDMNGDGYGDLIVGAFGYSGNTGRAYVYYGGPSPDAVADLTLTGGAVGDAFGLSVSSAGDVNGDGYGDVIVGADAYSSETGRAYVYYGGPGTDAVADMTLTGETVNSAFGISVSSAGDMNGDGFGDLIVGAQGYATSRGRAYVYFGGRVADVLPDLVLNGEAVLNLFGVSVSSAGDMNGDGYGDVIVGADNYSSATGRAYVYQGGPVADAVPDLTLTGEAAGSNFGFSVSSAGDVNDDGFGDVIVGADTYGGSTGRVTLYYGGAGADAFADIALVGEGAGNLFGYSVSSGGDVNGDGFADMIVSARDYSAAAGRAYLYDFNRYQLLSPVGGETWNVGATKSISWAGAEPAEVWLSADGGNTYQLQLSHAGGADRNAVSLRVPHLPSKFARVRLTPSDPRLTGHDQSDSLFTIQTSIALLSLLAAPLPSGGAELTWSTNPGPEDLAGYRLERAGVQGAWNTIAALTRETRFTDLAGGPGTRYRLSAVNGFGEELLLGETSLHARAPLAAWPLPYRGGEVTISFATFGGLGGGVGQAELSIYDVAGRLVKRIARGNYPAGHQLARWDGRDAAGRDAPAGVYFLRSQSAGIDHQMKVVVLR